MQYIRHEVFGWKLDHAVVKSGTVFTTSIPQTMLRNQMQNYTFYTKGELHGVNISGGYAPLNRYPGFSNENLPETILPATFRFTAVGDVEWWCFNWTVNRKQLPQITPLVVRAGESRTFHTGDQVLVCEGSLVVGDSTFSKAEEFTVVSSPQVIATAANVDTYCMIIK